MIIREETLKPYIQDWQPPTGTEIRTLLKEGDLSGSEAAAIVGVTSRTLRKWTGEDKKIPFSAWAVLVFSIRGQRIFG